MEFSVVEIGYDQAQVDSCLEELGRQLARMAAQAEAAAGASEELELVQEEVERLRELLSGKPGPYRTSTATRMQEMLAVAQEEAADIRARARDELAAAHEEAQLVRDRAYAEALQARREFEAALYARRQREQRADEILRDVDLVPATDAGPAGGPPTAVPATRVAAGDQSDRMVSAGDAVPGAEQSSGRPSDHRTAPAR